MSTDIFINKNFVKMPWSVFGTLYYELQGIGERDEILINYSSINKLIDFMGFVIENPCNGCFDVSDYLLDLNSTHVFMKMLAEAINNLRGGVAPDVLDSLLKLYNELMLYSNELMGQYK